jgi:hypothetical protein
MFDISEVGIVSMATSYGLDGTGIESRWGAKFFAPLQTGPGAHAASYKMGTVSFPVVKRPACGIDHPPHLIAEVKEKVELLPLLPSGFGGRQDACWPLVPK